MNLFIYCTISIYSIGVSINVTFINAAEMLEWWHADVPNPILRDNHWGTERRINIAGINRIKIALSNYDCRYAGQNRWL